MEYMNITKKLFQYTIFSNTIWYVNIWIFRVIGNSLEIKYFVILSKLYKWGEIKLQDSRNNSWPAEYH